jgi:uncharacterized membrane protein YkgB
MTTQKLDVPRVPSSFVRAFAAPAERLLTFVEATARRAAVPFTRFALAAVMLWFGLPKLIPGGSPAEDIAVMTVERLSGGMIGGDTARIAVGALETLLGIALVAGRAMPLVILAVLGHISATFAPLVLFPDLTWHGPMVGSLEGQYILKNIVIIACLIVLMGFGLRRRNVRQPVTNAAV